MRLNGILFGGLAVLLLLTWVLAPNLIRAVPFLSLLVWPLIIYFGMLAMGNRKQAQPARQHLPSFEMPPTEGLSRTERLKLLRQQQREVHAEIATLASELRGRDDTKSAIAQPRLNASAPDEAKSRLRVAS